MSAELLELGSAIGVSVTEASQVVTLPTLKAGKVPGAPKAFTARVAVTGTEPVFIKFSSQASVSVSITDGTPVFRGGPELFQVIDMTHCAVCTVPGTASFISITLCE